MMRTDAVERLRDLRENLYVSYCVTEGDIETRIAWGQLDLLDHIIEALDG